MKRKLFLVGLVLALVLFLVGCNGSGVIIPATDEAKIRGVINNFCIAVSNQDWNLAQSYYYPDSAGYSALEQLENLFNSYPQQTGVTMSITPTIYSINIVGNEATVLVSYYVQMCYQGDCESVSGEKQTQVLIKSGGKWYLI